VGDGRQWPVVAGQCTDGHHHRRAVAVGSASFEDDDIGVDDASIDAGSEGGADGVGGQAAMSEQHFDQSAGPGLITEPASRRRPEPLVLDAERTRGPRPGQGGGPRESAGLEPQHLEVVVEDQ